MQDEKSLIRFLQNLKKRISNRNAEDEKNIEEIKDIIHDYQLQSEELKEMMLKFKTVAKPVACGGGLYLCPDCGHRVNPQHSHCHWCGKMIEREMLSDGPKELDEGGRAFPSGKLGSSFNKQAGKSFKKNKKFNKK